MGSRRQWPFLKPFPVTWVVARGRVVCLSWGRSQALQRQSCGAGQPEGSEGLWTLAGSQPLHPWWGSVGLTHASASTAVLRWDSRRRSAGGEHVLPKIW